MKKKPMATPVSRKELLQGLNIAPLQPGARPTWIELVITAALVAGIVAWAYIDTAQKLGVN